MSIHDRMNADTPPLALEPEGGFPPNATHGPVDQVAIAMALAHDANEDRVTETVTIDLARLRHLERHYELAQSAIGLFKLGGGVTPSVKVFLDELGQEGDDRLRAVGAGVFARRPARETERRPYEALDGGHDQRKWDFDAMTAIASFLRDTPADPYSGRQCEEFVLDARDRLYAPDRYFLLKQAIEDLVRVNLSWRSVETDPPCPIGEQVDIIFTQEGDYGVYVGMVSGFGTLAEWVERTGSEDHWPGQYQWSVYDQQNDKYLEWEGDAPTLWMVKPMSPQHANMEALQAAGMNV